MRRVTPPGMPVIDTSDFELGLSPPDQRRAFRSNRPAFLDLIYGLIRELHLDYEIEHLKISSPERGRSELYREPGNPWPSKKLTLEIYPERCMDERLLRHELGHEADRRNPEMQYDPDIECRCPKCGALEVAANLSLDARLGERGLGRCHRWEEFREFVGDDSASLFAELWTSPPLTWPEIKTLAIRLAAIRRQGRDRL